jgi:hypothetical protein
MMRSRMTRDIVVDSSLDGPEAEFRYVGTLRR